MSLEILNSCALFTIGTIYIFIDLPGLPNYTRSSGSASSNVSFAWVSFISPCSSMSCRDVLRSSCEGSLCIVESWGSPELYSFLSVSTSWIASNICGSFLIPNSKILSLEIFYISRRYPYTVCFGRLRIVHENFLNIRIFFSKIFEKKCWFIIFCPVKFYFYWTILAARVYEGSI